MEYVARVVNFANQEEVKALLTQMGCDPAGIAIMTPKALFYTIVLEKIPTKAANLLKQTFLAKGAEVAVTRGTADLSVDVTDVLICATLKQYRLALTQLQQQPWGLPGIAEAVSEALKHNASIPNRRYEKRKPGWSIETGKTLVMGILNLTPDSFSDGGRYNELEVAIKRAQEMVAEGADIIDIGAESTRPYGGSVKISAEEELERLLPVLEKVLSISSVPVSVDTYKSKVAAAALERGAHIANDIWGLQQDPEMAAVVASHNVPVIVMHNRMSTDSKRDIIAELLDFFRSSMEIGVKAGISRDNFILDPGIGFGKTGMQNLEVLARLSELKTLGCPILIGTSRKRFIGDILKLPVEERDEGTGATLVHAIMSGASILRVHNVRMAVRTARMTDALQGWRRNDLG